MNERIKEIAIKAGLIAPCGSDLEGLREFDYRMFAKLIITECIDWCNAHARDDGTAQRIAQDIKKDFGVEE
jgi:hypothetical protein